jgi:predicted 3-demethylubiquinone-9 3-methyltransferase (glyoxalase superfamily)
MAAAQKITPFLWFNTEAEQAAKFYVSLFKDSKITSVDKFGPDGAVMSVKFELAGQQYVALNGNTKQPFNDSFSMLIACENQKEVDSFWDKLLADGGKPTQCGWLKDKFGVSWQVVPNELPAYLGERDPAKSQRIMKAFFAMQKIDLAALERAKAGA